MSADADDLYEIWHPDYFEVQRRDLKSYERLWAVLLRQLEKRTNGRWLIEFGSGPGLLLALAIKRKWACAHGIEPSGVARKHAHGLGVSCAEARSAYYSRMDAAIATEVLEHVENPTKTLLEWRAALAPGGFLAISVPNDFNPLQKLFWGRKKPWLHPTHKSYFSPRSLRELLERCGFEVVWQRTSFPVELLLVLPFLPRKWAWRLSRLWPAPPLLWRLHVGRHCLVIARKSAAASPGS